MSIEVETYDCTSVTDADLQELADLCAEGENPFSVGLLSKQTEEWVLLTVARDNGKLKGFIFSTLERIGGTPSVLIGLGSVGRNSRRDTTLRALMLELSKRALMAFPDEDVLIGAQFNHVSSYEAFKSLHDVVPRPDHRANGEERAWGRRLSKRFGIGASRYDDRAFIVAGDKDQARVLDHMSSKPEKTSADLAALLDDVKVDAGGSLIVHGWATADDLIKLA